jgi:hypothetical protein
MSTHAHRLNDSETDDYGTVEPTGNVPMFGAASGNFEKPTETANYSTVVTHHTLRRQPAAAAATSPTSGLGMVHNPIFTGSPPTAPSQNGRVWDSNIYAVGGGPSQQIAVRPKRDRLILGSTLVSNVVAIIALIIAIAALTKEHGCSCDAAMTAAASVAHNITAIDTRVSELAAELHAITSCALVYHVIMFFSLCMSQ